MLTGEENTVRTKLPTLNLAASSRGGRPLICGHRGARIHAPENTLAGFELAAQMGADLIELDVRLTRDGVLAVIHDATVDRTTNGTGRVSELSWDELQALDAGIRFGEAFAGQRIPSLPEVLDWAHGVVYLAVEIKEPAPLQPGVAERIAAAIRDAGMADQVTMHHIQQPDITVVRQVDSNIHVLCDWAAYLSDPRETIQRSLAIGASGVIWDWRYSTAELIAEAHAAGLAVYAADCPPTAEGVREARLRGVDILEADDVKAMAEAISASAS
ncbi:MAG: glycerophosphodiester phosphodiesterase [Chloroflexi bacterium]|nr:glycerophosphodiester phosphodiesterase [Chloroflexota bacterium]